MTPTLLRKQLFQTLRRVMRGETVIIETEEGEAILQARKSDTRAPRRAKHEPHLMPKVPGRILGSLDTADQALRDYLRLPA